MRDERCFTSTMSLIIAFHISGFLFAVGSMVVAGIVEIKRRNDDHHCVTQTIAHVNYTACMSIYYQIPQYGLIGVSEVFASVAGKYLSFSHVAVLLFWWITCR